MPVAQVARGLLSRLADGPTARGAVIAIVLKVASSLANIAMLTVLARQMGPVEFGRFAIWFNLLSFLAVIAMCGQETLIVRSWSEYVQSRRFDLARGALRFGITVSLSAAIVVATGVAAVSLGIGSSASPGLVGAACLFLVVQSLVWFSSNAARTIVGFVFGEGLREMWRLLVLLGCVALAVLSVPLTIPRVFLLCLAGISSIIAVQAVAIARSLPVEVRAAASAMKIGPWSRRSVPMWAAALLDASSQYLEVLLLGLLLSPIAAGGYFIAARLANVFAMIAGGMANYSATPIASLYFERRHAELQRALRTIALTIGALVLIGLVTVFAGADLLLAMFGRSYVDQRPILDVLAVGTAFAALGGPAMYVLLLTGRESFYAGVVVVGLTLRFLALVAFVPIYGGIAAAIAWSTCSIAVTIALNVVCRYFVGIDPSVVALFGSRSPRPLEFEPDLR